jgi:hypothetical protein
VQAVDRGFGVTAVGEVGGACGGVGARRRIDLSEGDDVRDLEVGTGVHLERVRIFAREAHRRVDQHLVGERWRSWRGGSLWSRGPRVWTLAHDHSSCELRLTA